MIKAKRAKTNKKLTDTQMIDLLMSDIDKELSFVESLTDQPKTNEYGKLSSLVNKYRLNSLTEGRGIHFAYKGSTNKEATSRIRNYLLNNDSVFNSSLTSLIKLRVAFTNNKSSDTVVLENDNELTLNIYKDILASSFLPEYIFTNIYMKHFIEQLSAISGYKPLEQTDQLLYKFFKEAKLLKWKEEWQWDQDKKDIFKKFFSFTGTKENSLLRILSFGAITKFSKDQDNYTTLERSSVKLFDYIQLSYVISIYNQI